MDTETISIFIAVIVPVATLVINRWVNLSSTRPKAAVAFLGKVRIAHSAIAGELGIAATPADLAALKEHLWFWQAARITRMYNAILLEQQQSESYRQKVKALHAYVSRFA